MSSAKVTPAAMTAINLLTISRIVFLMFSLLYPSDLFLFFTSVWAALSDFLDGFLARRLNLTSRLGEQLDQVTDKVFHFAMFFYLLNLGMIHFYFVALFLLREISIIFLRYFNLCEKTSNFLGKLKTFLTYTLIIFSFGQKVFGIESVSMGLVILLVFEITILIISYVSLILSLKKALLKRCK